MTPDPPDVSTFTVTFGGMETVASARTRGELAGSGASEIVADVFVLTVAVGGLDFVVVDTEEVDVAWIV